MSEAHCLSVKYLINNIVWPESNVVKIIQKHNYLFFKTSSKTINGVGVYAEEISLSLKKLTLRNELNYLTMLPLNNFIDNKGKGLLKNKKEWCPCCYNEQINCFGTKYDPLQWSLALVTRCHKHKIKLQSQCPDCESEQLMLGKHTPLGFCVCCGLDLSDIHMYKDLDTQIVEDSEWNQWLERNLNLLFSSSKELCDKYSHETFCLTINELIKKVSNGNALELERKFGFGNGTISQWRTGRNKPRFDYLLVFAYRLGLNLIDLLKYHENHECDINIKNNMTNPIVLLKTTKRISYDHDKIKKVIFNVLDKNIIISKAKLVNDLGVSAGYLNYRFPDESKLISINYRKHLRIKKENKFNYNANLIRQATIKLHNNGVYPSCNKVFNEVCKNTTIIFVNPGYKQVWENQIFDLGYNL